MLSAPPPSQPFNSLMASCENNVIVRLSCGDGETSFDAELNMKLGLAGTVGWWTLLLFSGSCVCVSRTSALERCTESIAEFIKLAKMQKGRIVLSVKSSPARARACAREHTHTHTHTQRHTPT